MGLVIETSGAVLERGSSITVTSLRLKLDFPPESVTRAVIVCSPTDNVLLIELPTPKEPSIFEDHRVRWLMSPSSKSVAVAEKSIDSPTMNSEPLEGVVIDI